MARDRASRPEAKPLRLFAAVEIPPEAKRVVASAVAPWREQFPKARWSPEDNWHVTLKFMGRTWPRLRGWVEERMRAATGGVEPFEVRLEGLGAFPSAGRARVVWAGVSDGTGRFAALAAAIDEALATEFPVETRPWHPHLTVGRSDPPIPLPDGFVDSPVEPVGFRIDRVALFQSHLRRPAPRYEALATFPLGGG
jgi:RNA 2',3'-cyclic 3'-phosphodiesterase